MKRLLLSIMATVGIAVIMPVSAFAEGGVTDVAGTVTKAGNPVSGASVSVLCGTTTLTSGTTAAGGYIVQFSAADCPDGSTAHVTATKGADSGSKNGTVNGLTASINLALINVSIPEYGLIGLTGATIIGGGAFLVMRRRQLSQS